MSTCQRETCDSRATHRSGIGNSEQQHLCPRHTNERAEAVPALWFRLIDDSTPIPSPRGRGQFRIRERHARSGSTWFELLYQPAEDHPGYPIWEPVSDFDTREAAEHFIDHPEPWFGAA